MTVPNDPTAIGPTADETVIVPPLTQAAPKLAWSDDPDDDPAPSPWGPVWLRVAMVVSCALAIAVVVAIVGLIIDDANTPPQPVPEGPTPTLAPAPTLPPQASPEPSREPNIAGPVSSAPSAVAETPPAPVVAPPAPAPGGDQLFLADMRRAGYPITETAVALAAAPKGCDYLATGHSPREAADLAMRNNPAISPEEASAYVEATIDAYCPQYRGELR